MNWMNFFKLNQTSIGDSKTYILKKATHEVNKNFEKRNEQQNKFYHELKKYQNAEQWPWYLE